MAGQRLSIWRFGAALVLLAPLWGCANGQLETSSPAQATPAALAEFSPEEQARILSMQEIVEEAAAEHALDPSLVNAIIWVESRFDTNAKSPAGAQGLMQLMPATAAYLAKRMGEPRPRAHDPEFNVRAGCLYLAEMRRKFGDEQLAVAAYHAGPGNVAKWTKAGTEMPDYSRSYVAKVMEARERFRGLHGVSTRARVGMVPERGPVAVDANADIELDEDGQPLVVPDLATLPTAAEVHGSTPEPVEPENQASRVADRWNTAPIELDPPVFEVHPELDRRDDEPPAGWAVAVPPREPNERRKPQTSAKPKPTEPKPKPVEPKPVEPEPNEPEVGVGVLPDL